MLYLEKLITMKLLSILLLFACSFAYSQASKYHKKYAFINAKGEIVFDVSAKYAYSFSNGLARVGVYTIVGNKAYYNYGFIDETGKMVIPAEYDKVYDFADGVDITWVRKRGEDKFILIDKNGKRVNDLAFKDVGFWIEGMCKVSVDNKDLKLYNGEYGKQHGFINNKGEVILDPDGGYFDVGSFNNGLACITKKGASGYGFIDKTGRVVIPLTLKQNGTSGYYEGMIRTTKGGKTGLIDTTGKFVVQPVYGTVSGFGEGLMSVAFGSSYNNFGYVDYNNKVVIKGQYDKATTFNHGFAEVGLNGKEGIINKKGEYILPMKYGTAYNKADEGYFMTLTDSKWQYFDTTGNEITKYKALGKNGFPVHDYDFDTKTGYYYNTDGDKAFPYKFSKVNSFTPNGLALVLLHDDESYKRASTNPALNKASNEINTDTPAKEEDVFGYNYTSKNYKWSMKLNAKPSEEYVKTKNGTDMLKITSPKSNAYQVYANASDLGKPAKKSKIDGVLKSTATSVLDKLGGTIQTQTYFELDGARAYRTLMKKDKLYYYYVDAVKENMFYQFIFVAFEDKFDNWKTFEAGITLMD